MKVSWPFKLLYFCNVVFYFLIVGTWIAISDEVTLNVALTLFNLFFSAILIVVDFKRFKVIAADRAYQNFFRSIITFFLLFCILGMINYLAYKNPWQIDLTKDSYNSLTVESISAVKALDDRLVISVFMRKGEERDVIKLLELYRLYKRDIEINFFDVDLSPQVVAQKEITNPKTVLFEYKGKEERVYHHDELDYTNALLKLKRDKKYNICFTITHGGPSLNEPDKHGIAHLKNILLKSNFDITPVYLNSFAALKSCDLLAIWGPKTAFFNSELNILKEYITNNRPLLLGIDPSIKTDAIADLRKMMKSFEIDVENNLLVDRLKFLDGSDGTVVYVDQFSQDHFITKKSKDAVFFPLPQAIISQIGRDSQFKDTILFTASPFPASWADKNPTEILSGKITYTENIDIKGPLPIAIARELKTGSGTTGRMVVFGNSSFVINAYAKFSSNFILVLNAITWLTDSNSLSSFNLALGNDEQLFVAGTMLGVVFYTVIFFVPLIAIVFAVVIYRRKRKL